MSEIHKLAAAPACNISWAASPPHALALASLVPTAQEGGCAVRDFPAAPALLRACAALTCAVLALVPVSTLTWIFLTQ